MQIKRFEAQDMTHALRLIKKQFGPQAVILSARTLKKEPGMFGFLKTPGVEVTAATDSYQIQSRPGASCEDSSDMYEGQIQPFEHRFSNAKEKSRHLQTHDVRFPRKKGAGNPSKSLISQAHQDEKSRLYRRLRSQGVEESIASELIDELNSLLSSVRSPTGDAERRTLIHILEDRGITTQRVRIEASKQKIAAFIGPPGVGKTSTIVKLAAAARTPNKSGGVALITLDNDRIAAIQQLEIYAKIIGIPIQAASNQRELKEAIKQFQKKSLILVDTAGLSKRNTRQIEALSATFQTIRHIEVHLLLSATMKEADLMDKIERFKAIPFTRLIFTKLDETSSYGNLLNLLIRTKIPLSYFTNSAEIPGGIEIATLEKLVDLIVTPEKERKVWSFSPGILKRKTGEAYAHMYRLKKQYQTGKK